ncbi:hypothetical protein GBA65_15105 [Rubrobacter marinus]|uniref:C2H2-type domain-containing protein n=1 Tax=Rubrobacter marinus TaxID=2653852 RepID=A0A6G8PZK8_9ACTN|nr:hypothetical protein [Rubrobacter marinus]QIN79632.1 hypothetical protein GBA65_15105 [Rubrobacter marinus]
MSKTRSTMSPGVGNACPRCTRVFDTPRGVAIHLRRSHGVEPEHGTTTAYRQGCRCEACREGAREQERRYARPAKHGSAVRAIDGGTETLKACLLAFGVRPEKLAEALKERGVEDLHWPLWLASGELRKHCRCEAPREIAEEMREAS